MYSPHVYSLLLCSFLLTVDRFELRKVLSAGMCLSAVMVTIAISLYIFMSMIPIEFLKKMCDQDFVARDKINNLF